MRHRIKEGVLLLCKKACSAPASQSVRRGSYAGFAGKAPLPQDSCVLSCELSLQQRGHSQVLLAEGLALLCSKASARKRCGPLVSAVVVHGDQVSLRMLLQLSKEGTGVLIVSIRHDNPFCVARACSHSLVCEVVQHAVVCWGPR